jgi:hypothetical protein
MNVIETLRALRKSLHHEIVYLFIVVMLEICF